MGFWWADVMTPRVYTLLNRLQGAIAAPNMAVLFGPVSQKYTPSAKLKPVRSILFLFLCSPADLWSQ